MNEKDPEMRPRYAGIGDETRRTTFLRETDQRTRLFIYHYIDLKLRELGDPEPDTYSFLGVCTRGRAL